MRWEKNPHPLPNYPADSHDTRRGLTTNNEIVDLPHQRTPGPDQETIAALERRSFSH
ncbi:hypothetical protein BDV33DRAFT_177426 [Aspergillus novoparasiticus]|uniref:Uncharacterized protein n=1 Tax=Aspergillus novoparasiticus TaxID=986946 RepID=A0A5N6EIC9_9EURO|nr:hypothetical protein BDV33DRAFT_177426 [Aspergillus novoparasiticus]